MLTSKNIEDNHLKVHVVHQLHSGHPLTPSQIMTLLQHHIFLETYALRGEIAGEGPGQGRGGEIAAALPGEGGCGEGPAAQPVSSKLLSRPPQGPQLFPHPSLFAICAKLPLPCTKYRTP